jgi:hypothetical protein
MPSSTPSIILSTSTMKPLKSIPSTRSTTMTTRRTRKPLIMIGGQCLPDIVDPRGPKGK